MMANKIESGISAEMRAYGFSGKRPYHFSRTYLRPWATRIDKGIIIKTIEFGSKPVITIVKTRRSVAIELREAKKPLVVEKRPMSAKAKTGKLTSGDKIGPSGLLLHEKIGATPVAILWKNRPVSKFLAKKSSSMTLGTLTILITRSAMPATTISPVMMNGIFGKRLITKRRCGCDKTKIIQKIAK